METPKPAKRTQRHFFTFTLGKFSREPSGAEHKRQVKIDPEDLIALGVLILAIAGALTALVIAILWGAGRVDGDSAKKIILGCVGAAAVSSLVASGLRKRNRT